MIELFIDNDKWEFKSLSISGDLLCDDWQCSVLIDSITIREKVKSMSNFVQYTDSSVIQQAEPSLFTVGGLIKGIKEVLIKCDGKLWYIPKAQVTVDSRNLAENWTPTAMPDIVLNIKRYKE